MVFSLTCCLCCFCCGCLLWDNDVEETDAASSQSVEISEKNDVEEHKSAFHEKIKDHIEKIKVHL